MKKGKSKPIFLNMSENIIIIVMKQNINKQLYKYLIIYTNINQTKKQNK